MQEDCIAVALGLPQLCPFSVAATSPNRQWQELQAIIVIALAFQAAPLHRREKNEARHLSRQEHVLLCITLGDTSYSMYCALSKGVYSFVHSQYRLTLRPAVSSSSGRCVINERDIL